MLTFLLTPLFYLFKFYRLEVYTVSTASDDAGFSFQFQLLWTFLNKLALQPFVTV